MCQADFEILPAAKAAQALAGDAALPVLVDSSALRLPSAAPREGHLRHAAPGDGCPECSSALEGTRGIEVGHVFHLGSKYSAPLKAVFVAEDGARAPIVMGCYGIGVTRAMAALVEVGADKDGIVWPEAVAPFRAAVVPAAKGSDLAAEHVYDRLQVRAVRPACL